MCDRDWDDENDTDTTLHRRRPREPKTGRPNAPGAPAQKCPCSGSGISRPFCYASPSYAILGAFRGLVEHEQRSYRTRANDGDSGKT
jgi:hypothetical protein